MLVYHILIMHTKCDDFSFFKCQVYQKHFSLMCSFFPLLFGNIYNWWLSAPQIIIHFNLS